MSILNDTFNFYDFVKWSDEILNIPKIQSNKNNEWWQYSVKTPQKNGIRAVFISRPIAQLLKINNKFWCLYSPELSAINGFDEYPEEITRSGFILCSILQCLQTNLEGAWFLVKVINIKLFRNALINSNATKSKNCLLATPLLDNFHNTKYKDWRYVFNNANESYIGNEFFIQKNKNNYHLICYVEWVYDIGLKENVSRAWFGNMIMTQEEIQMLHISS